MSTALLEKSGIALFGENWKHSMANALSVDIRNVRRWANNDVPVPAGVWAEIRRLLIAQSRACWDLALELPVAKEVCEPSL